MPYEIQRPTKRLRSLATATAAVLTCLGASALSASPALAESWTNSGSGSCSNPVLTQPFASIGDQNYYMLAPGESVDSFNGTGWMLFGGANIQSQTLADGSTGNVLDLPSGSVAISPLTCVNVTYVAMRAMVSDVSGANGVNYRVSYLGTGASDNGWLGGASQGGGFAPSNQVQLNPPGSGNWVMARFFFIAPSSNQNGDFQLYDFYVDPYSRG